MGIQVALEAAMEPLQRGLTLVETKVGLLDRTVDEIRLKGHEIDGIAG
ncbi:MAG: hypothetical protein OXC83_11190 [Chloroflexi bacterium]|nr:hypothetical protein [Chloroflexota bacterium]